MPDPVFLLTVASTVAVAACLKAGGYRRAENYICDAKDHHQALGHAWGPELQRTVRLAARSAGRGIGAARQSAPLPLERVGRELGDMHFSSPSWPIGGVDLIVAGSFFVPARSNFR